MRFPGNVAVCSHRFLTIGRIRVGERRQARIGVVIHFGDIGSAAGNDKREGREPPGAFRLSVAGHSRLGVRLRVDYCCTYLCRAGGDMIQRWDASIAFAKLFFFFPKTKPWAGSLGGSVSFTMGCPLARTSPAMMEVR
jgi:hypothetical protein